MDTEIAIGQDERMVGLLDCHRDEKDCAAGDVPGDV
jgi:hypothetical protein